MSEKEDEKLLIQEINDTLLFLQKGEKLKKTQDTIWNMLRGIRYKDHKNFMNILKGIHLENMIGNPNLIEDKKYIAGYNEAVKENNFAITLAIDILKEFYDYEK